MQVPLLTTSVTEAQRAAVRDWWTSFEEHSSALIELFQTGQSAISDLSAWMAKHLGAIHPDLMWEFGRGQTRSFQLTITPEVRQDLRPVVTFLLAAAPDLPEWEFHGYRPPVSFEDLGLIADQLCGWADLSAISVQFSPSEHRRIDLTYHLRFDEDANDAVEKGFLLTTPLLGERNLERWVGTVSAVPNAEQGETSLKAARREFARHQRMATAEDPAPYSVGVGEADWILVELQQEEQEDYAFKDDLVVSPFSSQELFEALHIGRDAFYSERFSASGETFLFLKTDGSAPDTSGATFSGRDELEDVLIEALTDEGLGTVIGGGTGLRYSYVDLVVTDLEAAINLMKEVLGGVKISSRSWFLFYDADLQAEWTGVYDDTPIPLLFDTQLPN